MTEITVVGGGLAGLVASIECAGAGASVRLLEARTEPGGRARSTEGPFVANFGGHVVYSNGPTWEWLAAHDALPETRGAPFGPVRFRSGGRLRRLPPAAIVRLLALRGRRAPDDVSFREWATARCGRRAAELAARGAGVFTFHHDPGELSAAFVWDRYRHVVGVPVPARYVVGGWSRLVERLAERARAAGVRIETGARVTELPSAPVIVATELGDARALLGDETVRWTSTRVVLLDVGLRSRRGDPYVVSDLDEACWAERFTAPDPSLAPPGHGLVQAHAGLRPGESSDEGTARLEALLDLAFTGWRERTAWRRRQVIDGRTGALDLPGTSPRDRPAVDRGGGAFLAGDMVAAPGLLSEVAVTSAVAAARGALAWAAAHAEPERAAA